MPNGLTPSPTQELQLAAQRIAGRIVRSTLDYLEPFVQEGNNPAAIEGLCRAYIGRQGGNVSYDRIGFPTSICVSVNDQVAHTPALSTTQFNAGDLVKLDLVVDIQCGDVNMYADSARTILIPGGQTEPRRAANFLNTHNKIALEEALRVVKAGKPVGTIGAAIEAYIAKVNKGTKKYSLALLSGLGGHTIGTEMHMLPLIPNKESEARGILQVGQVIAIEPLLTLGNGGHTMDGLAYVTTDGALAAHWEHTVLVTPDGHEQLT